MLCFARAVVSLVLLVVAVWWRRQLRALSVLAALERGPASGIEIGGAYARHN